MRRINYGKIVLSLETLSSHKVYNDNISSNNTIKLRKHYRSSTNSWEESQLSKLWKDGPF